MSSKPAHARKEQQIQLAKARKAEAKQSATDEQKERIREMRKLGFAPRKGPVTQKHFERYTAYLDSQAAATKSAVLQSELAVYAANGGLMPSIIEQLNKPGIKSTAYANLAATATRLLALGPTLADKMRIDAGAGSTALPEDDRIDSVLDKFGGDA